MAIQVGSEHLLILRRGQDLRTHRLELLPSVEAATTSWDSTARLSPVFYSSPLDRPDIARGKFGITFLGPIAPGLLPVDVPLFLTFGLYNAILIGSDKKSRKSIDRFLDEHPDVTWEHWEVSDGDVVSVQFAHSLLQPEPPITLPARPPHSTGLKSASEENFTLLAAATTKARKYFPKNAEDLQRFSKTFANKLSTRGDSHETYKLSWLVNVNAHLSRYTSQTSSGMSPIMATECHFWTHSLLGVGIATEALTKIRRFVEECIAEFDPVEQLEALKGVNPITDTPLMNTSQSDSIWERIPDALSNAWDRRKITENAGDDRLPLIVCFSGRDGFRSTLFSLSAPLEVITSCNTFGWSPMTLTHELSHIIVNGFLGKLFPSLESNASTADLSDMLSLTYRPRDFFQQVQQFALACIYAHREVMSPNRQPVDTPSELIEEESGAVNELLTHVIDFHLFYMRDEKTYVRSIWSSWDVIPNIKREVVPVNRTGFWRS